ncbi:DNA-directed RNA polymerase sigma-70 factor [Muriicola marianensis]|uniref:DNA-directed RNA polymerase sigma-70 factor n=2 Tax=Muriicola marianensis TaxID=1324801 RepID=A0ABQ1QSF1_9FLAO|nr:DNA-directed RNA polymerase sigma-70 factor [Muriicola marianensis]
MEQMKPTPDPELIQRTLEGDRQAFEALVDRYKHMVYTLAVRMLRNREVAEEAAQDTFLKAYKGLETYQGGARFSTWLYKIAYHNCLDRLKKMSRRPSTTPLEYQRYDGRETGGIEEGLEYEDKKRSIRMAIERLSEKDAALISMFYYDELSIAEISVISDLSPENIKIRLYRSRKQLASDLRPFMEAQKL